MKFMIIIITLLSTAAGAEVSIFDILDEPYITHISQLPTNNPKPDMNWQPSYEWILEHCKRDRSPYFIFGFLDIVGFERMVKFNGQYYLNESAMDAAIIKYETYACALAYPRFSGGWEYDIETYQQDNQFIARLTATAILYYYYGATKYYDNITQVFYDIEPLPLQYNLNLNPKVNIIEYNNSINPRTEILISSIPADITYNYNGDSITNYKLITHVENTTKGIYFANLSNTNIWTTGTGGALQQMNDKVIIPGTANPDYNNLTINVSSIYTTETIPLSEASVVRDTYNFKRAFSGLYITVIMMISIISGILYLTAKRAFSV